MDSRSQTRAVSWPSWLRRRMSFRVYPLVYRIGAKGEILVPTPVVYAEQTQQDTLLEFSEIPEDSDQSFTAQHANELYALDEDPELVEIFQEEAKELLQSIRYNYPTWQKEKENGLPLETIQRNLHTLKGSARLAGITPMGDLSYALEKVFVGLAESKVQESDTLWNAIQESLQTLTIQLDEVDRLHKVHWATDQVSLLESLYEGVIDDPEKTSSAELDDIFSIHDDDSQITSQEHEVEAGLELLESEDSSQNIAAEPVAVGYEDSAGFVHDADFFEATEDPELLEIFIEEAKDLLESLETSYHHWSNDTSDAQQLPQIQRTLHTLKGSARLAGVLPVGDLSHALESLFTSLVDSQMEPSAKLLSAHASGHR